MGLFDRYKKKDATKADQQYDFKADIEGRIAQLNNAPGAVRARMVSEKEAKKLFNEIYGPKLEAFNKMFGETYEAFKRFYSEIGTSKKSESSTVVSKVFIEYAFSHKKFDFYGILETFALIKASMGAPLDDKEKERINNVRKKRDDSSNVNEVNEYYKNCEDFIFKLKAQFDSLKNARNAEQSDSHKVR